MNKPIDPTIIAGVDEAGRGPLAGPVVAAVVILPAKLNPVLAGLKDSKLLTPAKRETLDLAIRQYAVDWAVGSATVEEIDTINILQATFLAMQRAVAQLKVSPDLVLIDGHLCPALPWPTQAEIKGDNRIRVISAASIVAKVWRDAYMKTLDKKYPQYGFCRHNGYGTSEHLTQLKRFGPCVEHRKSFSPVFEFYKARETLSETE